jgi:hypothetical protein
LLKSVNLQSLDTLISFDNVSLYTNVPADEVLQFIYNKLHNNDTLAERSALQAKAITDLYEVCLRTTHFQVDDKFFKQKWHGYGGLSITNRYQNLHEAF